MQEKTAVVICSGGMDSTTLLYDVLSQGYKVHVISFDYNQKHRIELSKVAQTCGKFGLVHKVLDISVLNEVAPSALTRESISVPEGHYADDNMKLTVVPNRNMVMLSLAAAYAISIKADKLYYGAHSGDHTIYPDCRPEFVEAMVQAIKLGDWHRVILEAPYSALDKGDIAIRGKELNVDYSLTWTCYNPQATDTEVLACGKCGACTERLEAFQKAEMADPIKYCNINN